LSGIASFGEDVTCSQISCITMNYLRSIY